MNASTWLDKVIGRPMSAMLPAERAAERIISTKGIATRRA